MRRHDQRCKACVAQIPANRVLCPSCGASWESSDEAARSAAIEAEQGTAARSIQIQLQQQWTTRRRLEVAALEVA